MKSNVLIMAGGTGGHIFPGLAVAECLHDNGWNIAWLGSVGGMEEKLVKANYIQLNLISVRGLRGNGLIGWIKAPIVLFKAILQAIKVIKQQRPCVVIGFGGFASGPGAIAALLLRKPVLIHEQNAIAGLTNKVIAKFAQQVFQGFPDTFNKTKKIVTVGNPVRKEIQALSVVTRQSKSNVSAIKVLIVGGSRGALALNQNLPKLLSELVLTGKVSVLHQVGAGRVEATKLICQQHALDSTNGYQVVEFIDDMAQAMQQADFIICRSGASTVSEVAIVGLPAIFIPFPYAVDDHQTANANWLVKNNAAFCFQESQIDSPELKQQIVKLVDSPSILDEMSVRAKQCAFNHAAAKVADYCENFKVKAA
ncbi:undecaprenyldiphospho-muramoylpentapeptide beta-N-acetylglucosaminyltransferase [Aliikangiella sp. IMCC44653]